MSTHIVGFVPPGDKWEKMKIYIFNNWKEPGSCLGEALSEDGHWLCSHLSSDEDWCKYDMGLTSDEKHDIYKKHCADYALEWIDKDNVMSHKGLIKAVELSKTIEQSNENHFKIKIEAHE